MTLFSHDEDPDDEKIYMKATETPTSEFPEELSETTIEPSVIPEIQSILDEIDIELKEQNAGQLKKVIKERLTIIKKMETALKKEKTAFAALIQMNSTEFANLTGNQKLLTSGEWVGNTDADYFMRADQIGRKDASRKNSWK